MSTGPFDKHALLACLRAIRPPANVEEWVQISPPAPDMPGGDYSRAIRDLLAALGVVSEKTWDITSPNAYYLVQSLVHSIEDGALTSASWQGRTGDGCAGTGARLVHLLEENRLTCVDNPTPVRIIQAVIAVIKARRGDQDVYLMQYDEKAEQFQPLGGKRELSDPSAEAALARELCEELLIDHLTPGEDFQIRPLAEHVTMAEVSASVHLVTQYDHSFYHLTDIRFPLNTDHVTRWISAAELAARRSRDGLAVSSLLDDDMPGVLPTIGYSIAGPVC